MKIRFQENGDKSFQFDTNLQYCLKGFLPLVYFLVAIDSWSWKDWGKTFSKSLKAVEADLRRRLFCNLGHEWCVQREKKLLCLELAEFNWKILSDVVPLGGS